jgi:hypothetical protein
MAIKATRYPYGELSEKMRKSGGFTFDPRTGTYPSEGIAVAEPGAEKVHEIAGEPEIKRYALKHDAQLMQPGMHLGGWASGKKGETPRDVLDVTGVIPEHPRGHHMAEVHHRMHVNRQDAANDLSDFSDIDNPRAPYTAAEKAYDFGEADEYGSQMRIVRPATRR